MEAFNKWYKEEHEPYYEDMYKDGWKAALEWAIEEIIGCLGPQDAIEMIREELEPPVCKTCNGSGLIQTFDQASQMADGDFCPDCPREDLEQFKHLRLNEVNGPRCVMHTFYKVTSPPFHSAWNSDCKICWKLWKDRCEEQEASE